MATLYAGTGKLVDNIQGLVYGKGGKISQLKMPAGEGRLLGLLWLLHTGLHVERPWQV
jgi:hypothetical protein